MDRFVHEQAARRRAALAGRTDRAEHDRRQGEFQIGGFVDDHRVVATEFEQAAAHALGDTLADRTTDPGRAGKADQGNAAVVDKGLCQVGAGIVEQEEQFGEAGVLQSLVADLHGRDRRQRGARRRLPDADIATNGGEERVPGPHRDRKIEGTDDADQTERMPLVVHAMTRPFGMHGVAVEHARLTDREVRDVDHFLHFAVAFRLDLAHFQRHQRSQRVLVLAQRLAAQAYRFATPGCRRGAPDFEGFLRALQDQFVIRLAGRVDFGNHLVGRRIHRLQDAGIGGPRPFATAEIGAGIGFAEAECLENVSGHGISRVGLNEGAPDRRAGMGLFTSFASDADGTVPVWAAPGPGAQALSRSRTGQPHSLAQTGRHENRRPFRVGCSGAGYPRVTGRTRLKPSRSDRRRR